MVSGASSSDKEVQKKSTEELEGRAPSGEPDVYIDVDHLRVGEICVDVEKLQADLALNAKLANLLLVAGAHVSIDQVKVDIKDVEAQASLKVRLENVYDILDRALSTHSATSSARLEVVLRSSCLAALRVAAGLRSREGHQRRRAPAGVGLAAAGVGLLGGLLYKLQRCAQGRNQVTPSPIEVEREPIPDIEISATVKAREPRVRVAPQVSAERLGFPEDEAIRGTGATDCPIGSAPADARGVLEGVVPSGGQRHAGPYSGERQGRSASEAARGAGDDHHGAREVFRDLCLLRPYRQFAGSPRCRAP